MNAFAYFLLGATLMLALVMLKERLTGFRTQRPQDYASQTPQFDLRKHLNGPIQCEGMIYGPLGRVVSRFTGEMKGEWHGTRGVLSERFLYDSGNTLDRQWHLEIGNDGAITAEASDLVGQGKGQQMGSAATLCYQIRLPKDAGGYVLHVTDWMYLAPNGAVVNRSQFRKFGIKVAELVAVMRPLAAS